MRKMSPPRSIIRLLQLQLAMTMTVSVALLLISNAFYAYSALLGGLVCTLPNWLFAIIAFRHRGAHAAKRILVSFYWGEAVKLITTIGLFAVVLATVTVSPLTFIVTFIIAQFIFWLAPLLTH